MTNDEILNNFVETWPLSRVKNMSLQEYNKQGSKDTFCYMLEYGTRSLGNISGTAYSSKFEIYERKDKDNIPKSSDYGYDENYTWRNRSGIEKTREQAFEYTRNIIVEVIEASIANKFKSIDGEKLAPLVVWKIAFLYSNKKLLSISDRQAMRFLARLFGMKSYEKARISDLHKYLILNVDRSRFWDDMNILWSLYTTWKNSEVPHGNLEELAAKKGVTLKDIEDSFHQSTIKEIIITKKHNRLQQIIYDKLYSIYDHDVTMEDENIDIKVEHISHIDFYEVKIAKSAKYCIRLALGQIIEYAYNFKTSKKKELIIVGNHPLTSHDSEYINYLNTILVGMILRYQYNNY